MAQERINVPNIGESKDVDVVEVLVKAGARVEKEQTLIVLESDKASMDVPSPQAGVVRELKLKVGDKVSEGSPILTLDVEGGGAATTSTKPAPEPANDVPAKAEPRDKPNDEPQAEESQPPQSEPRQLRTTPPTANTNASVPAPAPAPSHLPYASPAIRRFARELGADLTQITGTAQGGRITKEDVQRHVKQALSQAKSGGSGFSLPDAPEIDFTQFGAITVEPLTKIQRLTGKNLSRSWITIPHVTQFDEADITELEEFRKKTKSENPELKLTLLTFFMKALVSALKAMPRFNASLDKSGENLVLKSYFHVGVAVDTPNGLVVPVIRDVDTKSLSQLAKELETVSERARARRLSMSDLQGASMTISSLGGIGGTAFTPIINPPEVAILGVSKARMAPVYKDGAFVPRLLCPLSLSYDHRVIDGAYAARFTTRLGAILGDIRQILL